MFGKISIGICVSKISTTFEWYEILSGLGSRVVEVSKDGYSP